MIPAVVDNNLLFTERSIIRSIHFCHFLSRIQCLYLLFILSVEASSGMCMGITYIVAVNLD